MLPTRNLIGIILSLTLYCCCWPTVWTAVQEDEPLVTTSSGVVRGLWKECPISKRRVKSFLGIPYAEPPVGKLRFKPPVPVEPWSGILNATLPPRHCMQKRLPIRILSDYLKRLILPEMGSAPSEDCLNLNVYVPDGISPNASVVIWIYGGGFARGSSAVPAIDPVTFVAETDTVAVIFNYRLASFGFLYFNHSDAPGNMGLMDQQLVLRWVQKNIANFSGNPDSVTLAGFSAGACSVGLHMLIPESQPLFKRAILQSGSPSSAFSSEKRQVVMDKGLELARNIGCPDSIENVNAVLECLREKSAEDLIDNQPQYSYDYVYIFRPVVDGTLLKDTPTNLLKNQTLLRLHTKEVISGTNMDESSMFLASFYPLTFSPLGKAARATWDEVRFIMEDFFGMTGISTDVILGLYGETVSSNKLVNQEAAAAIALGTDVIFTCPHAEFERAITSAGHKLYKYFLIHRPKNLEELGVPGWLGAHHALEINYVFGGAMLPLSKATAAEHAFSKRTMEYWGNFIKTGYPNKSQMDEGTIWPEYTFENEEYLVLAPNSSASGRFLRRKVCGFWQDIVPRLMKLQDPAIRGSLHIMIEV